MEQNYQKNNISLALFKRKNKILLIAIILLLLLMMALLFAIIKKDKLDGKRNDNTSLIITDVLFKEYSEGKLNTDEYVKNLLYAEYNDNLLDDKYSAMKKPELSEIDTFIRIHVNELSDSTLKYYAERLALKGVTFNAKKTKNSKKEENKVAFSDLLVDTVNADEYDEVVELDRAILSKNKHFIVWYTEDGNSATNYSTAKKVADGLEETIENYKEIFKYDFSVKPDIFSKGSSYDNQKEILEQENIDSKYLETTLPVYLINYDDCSLAKYISDSGVVAKFFKKIVGGDDYGATSFPYILIRPSAFSDYERLSQLYNHELFHHYQFHILCGNNECKPNDDPYIIEATANLASALATNKTTTSGFLNDWVGTSRKFADSLMSEEFSKKYGKNNIGYALFVYLYNYISIVDNGINILINSIYDNDFDALEHIMFATDIRDLIKIQRENTLKNLTQDYSNKNLIQSEEYNGDLPVINVNDYIKNIDSADKDLKQNISPLGSKYFRLPYNEEHTYEINFERDNNSVVTFIIAEKNNVFKVVDSADELYDYNHTFVSSDYEDFDNLYIVIANAKEKDNEYKITFDAKKRQMENISEKNYLSFNDCNIYDEEIIKKIDTYYFDKNETAYKVLYTMYLNSEADIDDYYQTILNNKNYTNVIKKKNIIQYQYTDEAFERRQTIKSKESISNYYGMTCNLGCLGDSCEWNTGTGNEIVDFDPNTIN